MADLPNHPPHVVQIYSFTDNRWRNVIGIKEGTTEPIYAGPDENLTLQEAANLRRQLDPSGMSSVHRVYAWYPDGHPSFFKR